MSGGPPPAHWVADALGSLKRLGLTRRALYDDVLRSTLESDPRYLGVWSCWEPDALDGRDRAHANQPGHDATGRYVPLYTRGAGPISVQPNSDYDTGEWYVRPRREGRQSVVDPYEYPVAGRSRFITTQVAPITVAGVFVGVAGVDFAVAQIPGAGCDGADGNAVERLLDRGYVFLDRHAGIDYCSPLSRRLLSRFVDSSAESHPIGCSAKAKFGAATTQSDRALPRALQSRLARWLDGPTQAVRDGWTFGAGDAELQVMPFFHADTGPGLILSQRARSAARAALSLREREVYGWMSEGKTNPEIAAILDLSVHTVKRHVEKVLQKLGAPNRAAAIALRIGPRTYPAPQLS